MLVIKEKNKKKKLGQLTTVLRLGLAPRNAVSSRTITAYSRWHSCCGHMFPNKGVGHQPGTP